MFNHVTRLNSVTDRRSDIFTTAVGYKDEVMCNSTQKLYRCSVDTVVRWYQICRRCV